MGDCEVCGAMKVGTRRTKMGNTPIEACGRCIDSMGLSVAAAPKPTTASPSSRTATSRTSGGYGGIGRKGKDIMLRREKELRDDFATAVRDARTDLGWDQRELAKRMAERVNIIQHTEGGKRPTDAVIKKFERILNVKLMELQSGDDERDVKRSSSREMTMADFFDQAKRDI
jgi:uncharacterized protein (TIGR00270 family)